MLQILAILDVKDFTAFEAYETFAVATMRQYSGRLVTAFKTQRQADGSGQEIHLLEFPDEASFQNYRNDAALAAKSELRSQAISNTTVVLSTQIKTYG